MFGPCVDAQSWRLPDRNVDPEQYWCNRARLQYGLEELDSRQRLGHVVGERCGGQGPTYKSLQAKSQYHLAETAVVPQNLYPQRDQLNAVRSARPPLFQADRDGSYLWNGQSDGHQSRCRRPPKASICFGTVSFRYAWMRQDRPGTTFPGLVTAERV